MAERAGQIDQEAEEDKEVRTSDDQHEDSDPVQNPPEEQEQHQTQPEEESECPGCQSMGVLTLPCGHKLCHSCIQASQEELGQTGCTICYGSQLMDTVLRSLLETLFHGQPRRRGVIPGAGEEGILAGDYGAKAEAGVEEETCAQHGEMLSLFCLEEEQLICQQCEADEHEEHQSCPVQEAVQDCKVRYETQDTGCTDLQSLAGLTT